ncbi:MAG: hypothetical protein JNK05_01850 [Myxococcales bacterium]|nr:hypothetical protein [Myxococcales bacterium]
MAYRDDREALEGHKAELEAKLASLRAQLAASKGLEGSVEETVKELEATYARLNATKAAPKKRALPLLQRVYIASPCNVPWESMTGDERERMCASCNKTVYDVSQMTTAEAESLLQAKGTDACLRIFRRFDGTILTQDCPVGVEKKKRARRRGVVAGVLAATAAATAGAALSTHRTQGAPHVAATTQVLGTTTTTVTNTPVVPHEGTQLPPGVPSIQPVAAGGIGIMPPPPRADQPRTRRSQVRPHR